MPYEKTEGVVLRKVDFSETSRIVTFLTPHRGRMACMARGARRKGNPLAAALDTFNRCELTYSWKDTRQVQTLVEAVVLDSYGPLKQDVLRMAAASFVLETAHHASHENNPAPEIYLTLTGGLATLTEQDATAALCAAMAVFGILVAAGHGPDDSEDALKPYTRRMSPQQRATLRRALLFLAGHSEETLAPEALRLLLRFLHDYASSQFETMFKSFSFLSSVLQE